MELPCRLRRTRRLVANNSDTLLGVGRDTNLVVGYISDLPKTAANNELSEVSFAGVARSRYWWIQ